MSCALRCQTPSRLCFSAFICYGKRVFTFIVLRVGRMYDVRVVLRLLVH